MTNNDSRARDDWEQRIGAESGTVAGSKIPVLPAPSSVTVTAGRGQVTVDWDPVAGAAGYLVLRSSAADGPFEAVDHLGGDVKAVPHGPYADTTAPVGAEVWYAVASVATVKDPGPHGVPVVARSLTEGQATVAVRVDASDVRGPLPRPWQPMIGAEHLSHMLCEETSGGRPIGEELTAALVRMREEIGVDSVRSHAILCDDLGVYREVDGEPVHNFTGVDAVYDKLLGLGLRPVVELSFMPHDLAQDPSKTVFGYNAIVSPPKDWDRWGALITDLVQHLVDRYGLEEVRDRWSFEVWNEANLEVFWSGTPEEFFRLYDVTALAVKAVHPDLLVGGPSSAAAGWVEELLAHLDESGAPIDFVTTHTYGNAPLDVRPILARHGRAGLPVWWTEWGVTPTHFNPVNDSAFSAAFLLRGMRSAAERVEALAYWVASDHFEELGRPPKLLHGGFGLQSVGNLRKPRYRALELAARLGPDELGVSAAGDGAGSLVETWAARADDGTITVLAWNLTLDQSKFSGDPLLDRTVALTVAGLTASAYRVRHLRVDEEHSNITKVWQEMSAGADWPDDEQWALLAKADRLERLGPDEDVRAASGVVDLSFTLPMPGISFLELKPL